MNKEQKFYQALQDVFIGAKIEGKGGFINLMRIKSNYYRKIEELLKDDIEKALEKYPKFRDELFDKLYSFFSRYFTESGSIYFNSTPFHNNVYEKVYTNEKDVVLFWKTQMLYYVKTDRIFRSLEVEVDNKKFYFDVSGLEHKKANEKRNLIYELKEVKEDKTIHLNVSYSERGRITKIEDILKELKKQKINITEEQLERAFRVFEKQSEVDFFINKNAKAFLQEQFKLWSYQYFWDGAKEWTADRVNELAILKDIAFKIIDFVSQFEDELVKIWNKPKFVKNSNYVITLDKLFPSHRGDEGVLNFPSHRGDEGVLNFPSHRGDEGVFSDGVVKWYELPYNPNLKERARELRKAGNLSEVLLWQRVKGKQFLGLDFDRQKIVGNYIVDFFVKDIGAVIEIDGGSHNDKIEYDRERDKYLQSLGLKVIHIRDEDVKTNLDGVMEYLKEVLTPLTPLKEGDYTPLTPLKEGDLVERILKHPNIHLQIQEWQELGIVDENFKVDDVFETDPTGKHLSKRYKHLPIDTKYFKDLEFEILSLFDDLDNQLDGWLIKSENYQALNTILPKFKEKVQTIYIDPPFNLDSSNQFLYRTNYKDANWATLLENRIRIAKDWLNDKGSIFVRCDYNGNWIVRCLLDDVFRNFLNEIQVNRIVKTGFGANRFPTATDSLFYYVKSENFLFKGFRKKLPKPKEPWWHDMTSMTAGKLGGKPRIIFGVEMFPHTAGRAWTFGQEKINQLEKEGKIRIRCSNCGYLHYKGVWKGCPECNENKPRVEYLVETDGREPIDTDWTDIPGYSFGWNFQTENSEQLLQRVIESTSNKGDLVMDFFLGSGTTTAVAHKLGRKWIGVEMGEHFHSVVLPRMKKVLFYDKSGISKDLKIPRQTSSDTPLKEGNYYEGGGFFKYYELEQYEETLANCKYEDGDLFTVPNRSPYQEYVFMKDEKMLKVLEIDYKNNKVKVDLDKLYSNIDIAETLSNLTGKWIKKITPLTPLRDGNKTPLTPLREGETPRPSDTPLREGNLEVEFEDGTKINTKDLDYKLIKPLIWWE